MGMCKAKTKTTGMCKAKTTAPQSLKLQRGSRLVLSIHINQVLFLYQPQIGSQIYHQMSMFQLLGCSLHQGRTST